MSVASRLDQWHLAARHNKWLRYFTWFNRIALAAGFIIAGMVKILGERFASGLSVRHPMGNYLEALFHTGYYYSFIGYVQVIAAILLLIPRTTTLGALIYFPVILNICVLSLAVGFEGSLVTSPLMVLANLYLLCWDYDKLKYILSFRELPNTQAPGNNKFPARFFAAVVVIVVLTVVIVNNAYHKTTRNSYKDCANDCKTADNSQACFDFCDCIHNQGRSFNECAEEMRRKQAASDQNQME